MIFVSTTFAHLNQELKMFKNFSKLSMAVGKPSDWKMFAPHLRKVGVCGNLSLEEFHKAPGNTLGIERYEFY